MPATALSEIRAGLPALPPGVAPPAPSDLLAVLAEVPDPRKRRGRRHRLAAILSVSVCAMLGGSSSYVAIAEWGADNLSAVVRLRLGLGRRQISETTIRRVLQAVDAEALSMAVCAWIATRVPGAAGGFRHVAIDGKTMRGARSTEGSVHLLAAFDVTSGAVLGQVRVDGKSNEITAFVPLCKALGVGEVLVTADAMHTQRDHVEHLHTAGAHWILIAKGNQPTLHNQLKALPWADVPITHTEAGKAHGRTEKRTVQVVQIAAGIEFPHAKLAIKCVRTRAPRGARRQSETVYAITDLTWHQITSAQIADALRNHWHIENRLHWVRDVTFAEDLSQIRTGNGPAVMAVLRNLVISLHRLAGATNIAAALRHHARDATRPLQLLKII